MPLFLGVVPGQQPQSRLKRRRLLQFFNATAARLRISPLNSLRRCFISGFTLRELQDSQTGFCARQMETCSAHTLGQPKSRQRGSGSTELHPLTGQRAGLRAWAPAWPRQTLLACAAESSAAGRNRESLPWAGWRLSCSLPLLSPHSVQDCLSCPQFEQQGAPHHLLQ